MYDASTVSPDTNVLMVYARGDDENTYRTSSAYWSLLVQVPEAQKRRELYCALADEAALEPAKEYFEMGLPGMEEELARYQATKKILDRCPSSGSGSRRKKRYCINSCRRQTGRFGRLGNNWHRVGKFRIMPRRWSGIPRQQRAAWIAGTKT